MYMSAIVLGLFLCLNYTLTIVNAFKIKFETSKKLMDIIYVFINLNIKN